MTTPPVLVLLHPEIATACPPSLLKTLPPAAVDNKTFKRFNIPAHFTLQPKDKQLLLNAKIDWAILPDMHFSDLGLIVSDMDSTLITIECIDEIAERMHIKEQISAITERAMQGELDFTQSLMERVALLRGLPIEELAFVYDHVLSLSQGAEALIAHCHQHDVKFMLISGGFDFFTERLKNTLGLDFAYANHLETQDGLLTGRVIGRVIDAKAKRQLLLEKQSEYQLQPQQVLAMGDGANDIPMLEAAGLSLAFHAKPKTREHALFSFDFWGLDQLINLFK